MKHKVGRPGKKFKLARVIDRQHAHYGSLVRFDHYSKYGIVCKYTEDDWLDVFTLKQLRRLA